MIEIKLYLKVIKATSARILDFIKHFVGELHLQFPTRITISCHWKLLQFQLLSEAY